MPKYPKWFLLHRNYSSVLNRTNILSNLINLHKYYTSENYDSELNYTGGINWVYKNNFYTQQTVEFMREILIYSWNKWDLSIWDNSLLEFFVNNYRLFKEVLEREKFKKDNKLKRDIIFPLSHQQLWYQKIETNLKLHLNYFLNYYSDSDLNLYLKNKLGISYERLLLVWYLLFNLSKQNCYFDLFNINWLYKKELKYIVDNFSVWLEGLQSLLQTNKKEVNIFNSLTDLESYWFENIYNKPLIEKNWNYLLPIPILLLNRITNFIYYDFDEAFKRDVLWIKNQEFILKCIYENIDSKKYKVYNTDDYRWNYKNIPPNPDIILEWENNILFIECKSNPLSYQSMKWEITDYDYNRKIKKNIKQVYNSIEFYKNKLDDWNNYFWLTKSHKNVTSIILYNKNPYLSFWEYLNELLNDIKDDWEIEEDIIKNHKPFILDNIWLIDLIEIVNSIWLDDFLNEISLTKYNWWELELIMNSIIKNNKIDRSFHFSKDIKELIDKELQNIAINSY